MADERSPALQELDKQIKENVQRGLVFLREKYGEDWVDHINLETLELTASDRCVLGQVHPHYYSTNEYGDDGYDAAKQEFAFSDYGRSYGFAVGEESLPYSEHGKAWQILQKAWEDVIPDEQRRVRRKREAGLL